MFHVMLYRSLPDLTAPTEADLDTAAMAATQAAVERGERHLRVLARLTEIGMNLAEALGDLAEARIEVAKKAARNEDAAPAPFEDSTTTAFNKIAQTVRRTVALEAKLAAGVKAGREGLIAERAGRRADLEKDHKSAKDQAILYGFHDAYAGSTPDAEYEEQVERLMGDVEEYLGDADEFRGYLDRPVGETVARLCAALGLDTDACALDGESWKVRRKPTEFELLLAERARKFPPSPNEEGQDAKRPGWGSPDEIPRRC